jgi:hypothetical protein
MYTFMRNSKNGGSAEYEKAICFLEIGCHCGCSKKIPREKFAELREAFQALSRSEQDMLLMAQLETVNGEEITAGRRLKKKRVLIRELLIAIHLFVRKRISICYELAALIWKTSEVT